VAAKTEMHNAETFSKNVFGFKKILDDRNVESCLDKQKRQESVVYRRIMMWEMFKIYG